MRYLSVCSGIEAASVAWHPLGWEPVAFSEIEAFPSAVLKAHYPNTPNLGDMTKFQEWPDLAIDLLVGGTPCQSFSVAGLRRGLADPRGSLMLTFGAIARRYRPKWLLWENVPGVLSSNGGRDFGAFLGMLGLLGYGYAYRVLDAQFFGLAQRRKRVFVVGYLGDWRPAAAVFLERAGLRGDSAPRRETRKDVAPTISARAQGGGGLGTDAELDGALIAPDVSPALKARDYKGPSSDGDGDGDGAPLIAHALRADGFDASEDGTGRGTPLVPVAFAQNTRDEVRVQGDGDISGALAAEPGMKQQTYVAFILHGSDGTASVATETELAGAIRTKPPGAIENSSTTIAFAIQERAVSENPDNGPQGAGVREEVAYTLEARHHAQAVAQTFTITPSNSNADYNVRESDKAQALTTNGNRVSARGGDLVAMAFDARQSDVLQCGDMSGPLDTDGHSVALAFTGDFHADAKEAGPIEALRALRNATDEEALTEWCLGILAAFWPAEVLQSEVHGRRFRRAAQPERGLVNVALSRAQAGSFWSVLDLWEAGCEGRPPSGWRPSEQLARQLGAYLSQLPYSPSPAARFLHAMWSASEGSGLLRQALSAVQKARQSACGERQSAHRGSAVRRLVVDECEALQGFPRGYTNITYRGKPAADGPRYKALGNSMAVPCMRWIAERIERVRQVAATETPHA